MKNEMDDIKAMWEQAKDKSSQQPPFDVPSLIAKGEARKKSALAAHFGNALILSATLAMLIFYFYYLYSFQFIWSKIGINLMIGGLAVRIAIEIFSAIQSRKIKISDTAAQSLQNSIAFYEFRKHIHGPITKIIFGLYFVGFYMLTPEFSKYLSLFWVILIDTSAVVIAAVLIKVIGRGIRQELVDLEKMVELHTSLTK